MASATPSITLSEEYQTLVNIDRTFSGGTEQDTRAFWRCYNKQIKGKNVEENERQGWEEYQAFELLTKWARRAHEYHIDISDTGLTFHF